MTVAGCNALDKHNMSIDMKVFSHLNAALTQQMGGQVQQKIGAVTVERFGYWITSDSLGQLLHDVDNQRQLHH